MRVERWLIGFCVAWLTSIPITYVFEEITRAKMGRGGVMSPMVKFIYDCIETTHTGPIAVLLMVGAFTISWLGPYFILLLAIGLCFKYVHLRFGASTASQQDKGS